jgi:hypothetical protein
MAGYDFLVFHLCSFHAFILKERRSSANDGTTLPTVARNDKAGVLRQTPKRGKNKPLLLSPLQGEPFRVNPSPFHGERDIEGEVKKISRKEYFSAFA